MRARDRLRAWITRSRDGSAGVAANDGTTEAVPHPDPVTAPSEPAQVPPVDPVGALLVAKGHELLGPCRGCGGHWTRELTRGQKPLTCPVCKRQGPPTS